MGDCRLRILVSKSLLEKEDSSNKSKSCSTELHGYASFSKAYSADTAIREVVQDDHGLVVGASATNVSSSTNTSTTTTILSLLQDGHAKLWDCSKHPPQDITTWPLSLYSEISGSKSKTLYDVGWYPSGSLQVLPSDIECPSVASADAYDDVQYNTKSSSSTAPGVATADESSLNTNKRVRVVVQQTSSTGKDDNNTHPQLLPSQLLQSVTHRFDGDDTVRSDHAASEAASLLRQQNKLAARQKELQRHQRLEARIRKLQLQQQESTGIKNKNKAVSDQVRCMLIKSRATGRANLEQQDRVYLHCLIDDCTTTTTNTYNSNSTTGQEEDDDLPLLQEEYLYFSRQDTVGSVVTKLGSKASISSTAVQQHAGSSNTDAELLVLTKTLNNKKDDSAVDDAGVVVGGGGLYQRLPVLMRLYEGMSLGYLRPVDEVVLRIYDPSKEDASTSIDDHMIDKSPADEISQYDDISPVHAASSPDSNLNEVESPPIEESSSCASGDEDVIVIERLGQAIQAMDQSLDKGKNSKTKSPKKESAAVNKVAMMKIKSQAKGDAKRVKEMSDRFFVQLVTAIIDDNGDDDAAARSCTCNLSIVFCSKKDTFDRLFRDCVKAPAEIGKMEDSWQWELLAEKNDSPSHFRQLDKTCSKTLAELEAEGHVQSFGRMIVLFTKKVEWCF
jgi:hypothetical protein